MSNRTTYGILALTSILIVYFTSIHFNDWLSTTMQRHQLIQLPVMLLNGMLWGIILKNIKFKEQSSGISILIFIMASLIFWMLPRSIDMAVIYPSFNRVMHINMLLAGFLWIAALRSVILEIKILFLLMVAAMLMATGVTLRVFDILLCSSFSIEQQKNTAIYLMIISVGLLLFSLVTFFRIPSQVKQ